MTSGGDLLVRRIGRLTTWAGPRVADAAVLIEAGRVAWTGPDADIPVSFDGPELDVEGAAVIPAFVDCHTHAVWAGCRRDDVCARLAEPGYSPGGIASTVAATAAASYDDLVALTAERLAEMRGQGTATVEVKSGYALTPDGELRLLEAAREAAVAAGVEVVTTYLGAHVVPPGRDRDGYVAGVLATLPAARAAGATGADVFCDDGAFSVEEARTILAAAAEQGFRLHLHAGQLASIGAAGLAAELGCASADHLDHVSDAEAAALAAAGVVAVLVPVVSLHTRSGAWAHAARLRAAGCTLAVSTDCNPGSAWCESMPYAVQLACLAMGLGVDEALRAATRGGATALGREDLGHLGTGARGHLAVLTSDHEADLVAHLGVAAVAHTVVGGEF